MDITTSIIAVCANVALLAVNTDTVTTWVTCICAALITIGTTVIQLYRMWRDRNDDEQNNSDQSENKDEHSDNSDQSE